MGSLGARPHEDGPNPNRGLWQLAAGLMETEQRALRGLTVQLTVGGDRLWVCVEGGWNSCGAASLKVQRC